MNGERGALTVASKTTLILGGLNPPQSAAIEQALTGAETGGFWGGVVCQSHLFGNRVYSHMKPVRHQTDDKRGYLSDVSQSCRRAIRPTSTMAASNKSAKVGGSATATGVTT